MYRPKRLYILQTQEYSAYPVYIKPQSHVHPGICWNSLPSHSKVTSLAAPRGTDWSLELSGIALHTFPGNVSSRIHWGSLAHPSLETTV